MATDTPPDGAIASADDFQHKRDADGNRVPVWEPIPGTSTRCPDCTGSGMVDPDTDDEEDADPVACDTCSGAGEVPEYAEVVPLTQGDAEEYLPENGEPGDITDANLVALFDEFFKQPDFDIDRSRDAEEVLRDEFSAWGVDPLIMCLYNASGFDYAKSAMMENTDMAELLAAIEGNSQTGN